MPVSTPSPAHHVLLPCALAALAVFTCWALRRPLTVDWDTQRSYLDFVARSRGAHGFVAARTEPRAEHRPRLRARLGDGDGRSLPVRGPAGHAQPRAQAHGHIPAPVEEDVAGATPRVKQWWLTPCPLTGGSPTQIFDILSAPRGSRLVDLIAKWRSSVVDWWRLRLNPGRSGVTSKSFASTAPRRDFLRGHSLRAGWRSWCSRRL